MTSTAPTSDQNGDFAWRRWLLLLIAMITTGTVVLLAFVVLADPFSTGRLTPIDRIEYVARNQLYDNAARVRDPRFDSAIVGTSTAVAIWPAALSQATGRRFAMLAIQGAWPREHIYLIQAFDRFHSAPAYVIVLDDLWCLRMSGSGHVLPRWLFEGSDLAYLSRILSPYSIRVAWRRLLVIFGFSAGQPADGYDPNPWEPLGFERFRPRMETMSRPVDGDDADAPFPYLDELERALAEIKPQGYVLMVFTPVFAKFLPVPGSRADARLRACKDRAEVMARGRARSGMLDLRVDGPKVADIDNFTDEIHFKPSIARDVEAAIAQRLKAMTDAPAR